MLKTKAVTRNQEKFYRTLFSNFDSYVEIRTIDKANKVEQQFFKVNELMNYEAPTDKNVYVGVYERRYKGNGKISNCTVTNAIYLDFDDTTLDAIKLTIDMTGVPLPSMIVNSGHGYHVYWKLDKPIGHEAKPVISKLQEVLNADANAVDIARVLRVPDTMNVKDEPVASELVEVNQNVTSIKQLEDILGVKAVVERAKGTGVIKELADIKYNGLNNMAKGVAKGERNFCTGRIVQTLKRLNFTKQETTDIVYRWNTLNKPQKSVKELKKDIMTYWFSKEDNNRYRYDGKEFSDDRLEDLNNRFIDDETTFFIGNDDSFHSYDNELLNPKVFQKARGLTFAILSIIKLEESKGIRREHLADLSKRNEKDKMLRESLNLLEKLKYIKVIKKNRINHYVFTEKGNYSRGYTAVSKSLHRSYIHEELKEHEYKLMILLESYAYDNKKEVYPSNQTLALRLGQSDRTVRRNLKQLEHKQFVKQEIKQGKSFIRFIYR